MDVMVGPAGLGAGFGAGGGGGGGGGLITKGLGGGACTA